MKTSLLQNITHELNHHHNRTQNTKTPKIMNWKPHSLTHSFIYFTFFQAQIWAQGFQRTKITETTKRTNKKAIQQTCNCKNEFVPVLLILISFYRKQKSRTASQQNRFIIRDSPVHDQMTENMADPVQLYLPTYLPTYLPALLTYLPKLPTYL